MCACARIQTSWKGHHENACARETLTKHITSNYVGTEQPTTDGTHMLELKKFGYSFTWIAMKEFVCCKDIASFLPIASAQRMNTCMQWTNKGLRWQETVGLRRLPKRGSHSLCLNMSRGDRPRAGRAYHLLPLWTWDSLGVNCNAHKFIRIFVVAKTTVTSHARRAFSNELHASNGAFLCSICSRSLMSVHANQPTL